MFLCIIFKIHDGQLLLRVRWIIQIMASISSAPLDSLQMNSNLGQLENVGKALGLRIRLEILQYLGTDTYSIAEIADALGLPLSTANFHMKVLEKSGLISNVFAASYAWAAKNVYACF